MESENSSSDQIQASFPSSSSMSVLDLAGDVVGPGKRSLGFMELLGIQDLGPSIFDFSDQRTAPQITESPDAANFPATPNSSSISSSSTEAANDEQTKEVEEEEEEDVQEKAKKLSKPRKTSQKRAREPRFAFMTKSEVDHLEDGYRWRKYGQKAVKNSHYPRSYYRCTSAMCGVKKRVERSFEDPTVVVTTYEGQHTHQSPVGPRGSNAATSPDYLGFATSPTSGFPFSMQLTQSHHHRHFQNLPPHLNPGSQEMRPRRALTRTLQRDHGLLQDIVHTRKEE